MSVEKKEWVGTFASTHYNRFIAFVKGTIRLEFPVSLPQNSSNLKSQVSMEYTGEYQRGLKLEFPVTIHVDNYQIQKLEGSFEGNCLNLTITEFKPEVISGVYSLSPVFDVGKFELHPLGEEGEENVNSDGNYCQIM